MKEKTEREKMTQSEKYQLMLKKQIKQAGEWLIDNSERIVWELESLCLKKLEDEQ